MLNKFFFRLSIRTLVAKTQADKVVRRCPDRDFLRPVFSAHRVQHVSDLHSKFALGPHHGSNYGRHPISDRRDQTRKRKKKKKKEEEEERRKKPQGKNIMACPITQGDHNYDSVNFNRFGISLNQFVECVKLNKNWLSTQFWFLRAFVVTSC